MLTLGSKVVKISRRKNWYQHAVAAVAEHFLERAGTTHTRANTVTDFREMHVLIKLIWVRHVESVCGRDHGLKRATINLIDDILKNTVAASVPARRNLTSDGTVKNEGLRDVYSCALLELHVPFTAFRGPDVVLVLVLMLVVCRFLLGNLQKLEVVNEFNLLVESLVRRDVAAEDLRLCIATLGKNYGGD